MGTNQILDLLGHVYGPYPDHVILKADFPRQGIKLAINDLQLNFSGEAEIAGFDETEYITNPPVGSRIARNPDVVFFGVIGIEDLDWLSDQGLRFLERDFMEQDAKIFMEHDRSGLTIKKAYSVRKPDWPCLKVRICCRKSLLAHYLTSKTDPEKLLIYSEFEQKKRTYWVQSCHIATLQKSRNFMARYQIRAMVAELIKTDPQHTPLEDRNIDWVVHRYFETIRPRDKEIRTFKEPDHNYAPRHLRHVPRAYIRGFLAEHAEWLLAHLIARKQGSAKLLDIWQWISFCKEARKDSIQALEAGKKWGNQSNANGDYNLSRNLAQFGETQKFWENQLKIIYKKKKRPAQKPRESSPEIEIVQNNVPQATRYQYDPDFSEASTSEDSESEAETMSKHKIPGFCLHAPNIPGGRFVWNCPGCLYKIDLLNLTPVNMEVLPEDTIRGLSSKSWRMEETPVQRALFLMVSDHYENHHLAQNGVFLSQSGSLTWTTNNDDSQRERKPTGGIKVEDQSQASQPLRRSSRVPRPRRKSE